MVENLEKEWYAVQTYSGYEGKVKHDIESRTQSILGMENYIFRLVIPSEKKMVEKKGKLKEKEEYIFKGYVLIEMIMTDESWFVVRNTPNVTGFVGSHGAGSKPVPLLPEEINSILRAMGQFVRTTELDVEIGDTIQIIKGAFANMTGQVIEIDHDKQKLKVTIEMFGRETNAELDFSQVDVLD
ncbi:MAG: transcription termination/antitermination protein NusG [Lactobacillales bacterium]|jgi:transcriptional antiterminator NusG|nr:transcription termination/antitermination protein NusG [Lactobacillales bacterium]